MYFVHIMKDGGSSVDGYFECLATKLNFAVKHAEGSNNGLSGDQSCPAAFCTAHHSLDEKVDVCGSSFQDSAAFSILREPLSRIFSLINWYKYIRKAPALQGVDEVTGEEKDFRWVIKRYYKCHVEGSSDLLCSQLSNGMTLEYLTPNAATITLAHGAQARSMMHSMYQATLADLEAAKKSLKALDAVFFTEELDEWPALFGRSGLPFSESASVCELPFWNRCSGCEGYNNIDNETIQLATEMNALDIELYQYAKTLPNALES